VIPGTGIRIGLAFNLKPDTAADAGDRYAEWDDERTIAALESALSKAGHVVRLEATADFPDRLRAAGVDIVFNLAEGLGGPNREAHVPAICEFWEIPYVGSDVLTLSTCLDKGRAKEVLAFHGVATPSFTVTGDVADLRGVPRLPVIVKPVHEGSSKGVTQASYCRTTRDLRAAVAEVLERYRQPALIERWLPGREFTCAIIGNGAGARVLPIVEIDFTAMPPGVVPMYSWEAKWMWDVPARPLRIFECPARVSPALARRIERAALGAYAAVRCRDWARIDLRCDARGVPHVIDINPLPGVLPDPEMNSCFPKAARAAGLDYTAMILAVLEAGAARYGIPV